MTRLEEQWLYSELLPGDCAPHLSLWDSPATMWQKHILTAWNWQLVFSFKPQSSRPYIRAGRDLDRLVHQELCLSVSSFFTTTVKYNDCITADTALICLLLHLSHTLGWHSPLLRESLKMVNESGLSRIFSKMSVPHYNYCTVLLVTVQTKIEILNGW